jgi:DNA-binding GntR family transcriptional regulator
VERAFVTAAVSRSTKQPSGGGLGDGLTQRQLAATAIRSAITSGVLSPNEHLVESTLAQHLSVGRGVVRAALFDLVKEGLVEHVPHRGARVRALGVDEAIEIAEVRALLEGFCAGKAAKKATDSERRELTQIIAEMRQAVADLDIAAYNQLNRQMHARVREIAAQRTAANITEALLNQSVRQSFHISLIPGRIKASLHEHELVIDAIVAGNQAQAERAMRKHLEAVAADLRESWQA